MAGTFRSFAILPAAGESRRMGRPKLLLPWQDRTVIEAVLGTWQVSSIERIVVVVSPRDEALATRIRGERVELVIPKSPPPDMKASVVYGLEHIERTYHPDSTDVWLLSPADLPHLPAVVIEEVLRSYDPASPSVVVPTLLGKRGHPVLFPWSLVAEARTLGPDQGLNSLLARHTWLALACDHLASLAVWQDLDTPDDYYRAHGGDAGD